MVVSHVPRDMDDIGRMIGLGERSLGQGRLDDARRWFAGALAKAAKEPTALRGMSRVEEAAGSQVQSLRWLEALIAAEPGNVRNHHDHALCLIGMGRLAEAVASLRRAIEVCPSYGPAFCNLGLALEDLGDLPGAVAALRRAKALDQHASFVAYHLAAVEERAGLAQETPSICPPSYLLPLFDGYADRFDAHLFAALKYEGPRLLAEVVQRCRERLAPPPWDILDLGCGTGMSGVPFRAAARSLTGVDLSSRMLRHAEHRRTDGRKVYDSLQRCDLLAALASRAEAFDLLLAADVFIYVGDLGPVLGATRGALCRGGAFAFTTETLADGDGYRLLRTRRYAHSREYVQRVTEQAGLRMIECLPVALRLGDDGKPVAGDVYLVQRET